MVETPDGFVVALPAEIVEADPKADPAGYDALRGGVTRSIAGDLASVFADALRARAQPRINQASYRQHNGAHHHERPRQPRLRHLSLRL